MFHWAFPVVLLCAAAYAAEPIRWEASSLRLIEKGADYPRMARLGDGSAVIGYDKSGKMWLRRSADGGRTFAQAVLVAEEPGCWLTNAFPLSLADGRILYFWNERPLAAMRYAHKPAPPGVLTRPFLICMAESGDGGKTWSKAQTLHTAGPSFRTGCWEPAAIQLPSGEVHCYFANEAPFTDSDDQEISLIRSTDGGKSWSPAERIAYRKVSRDGMPNALLLPANKGIAVAIEDMHLTNDRFKPAIVFTTLADNWKSGSVGGDSEKRWGAMRPPLPDTSYAGGPYLAALPDGRTLISFQEGEDGRLESARMVVAIGDGEARNFSGKSHPFDDGVPQLWNSLFVRDERTVTALSSTTINGVHGVWAIDGTVPGK